jgi:hypothetical protein
MDFHCNGVLLVALLKMQIDTSLDCQIFKFRFLNITLSFLCV